MSGFHDLALGQDGSQRARDGTVWVGIGRSGEAWGVGEYQYYEFAAVDRPLEGRQIEVLRKLSTRARITPTSFVNTYEWGDFAGEPRRLVERYFDAFVHVANWGTRELMLRFPGRLVEPQTAQQYCSGGVSSAWSCGVHVIVSAVSEDEDSDLEWGGEGVLASILPVRSEVLTGDERPLYLLWLLGVQAGEVDDDVVEPPVPVGLDALSGSQAALVEFLRIDADLLAVAADGSEPLSEADIDVEGWVDGLAADERDALLVGLLRGKDSFLRTEALRRARSVLVQAVARRSVRQLAKEASVRRVGRERVEQVRRKRLAAARLRRVAEARQERLATLATEGEDAWVRVGALIAEKKPAGYDAAVELLVDLAGVSGEAEFARRVEALRAEYRRRPGLIGRLDAAGL